MSQEIHENSEEIYRVLTEDYDVPEEITYIAVDGGGLTHIAVNNNHHSGELNETVREAAEDHGWELEHGPDYDRYWFHISH